VVTSNNNNKWDNKDNQEDIEGDIEVLEGEMIEAEDSLEEVIVEDMEGKEEVDSVVDISKESITRDRIERYI